MRGGSGVSLDGTGCFRVGQSPRVPTIDDLLAVKTLGGAQLSPDGRFVAYTVTEADLENDAFVTQLWIAPVDGGAAFQLTRGTKSVGATRWSPDGRWIAFTSPRIEDRNQVFAIRPDGGEAVQLTAAESPVSDFAWSPDGATIAFLAPEPDSPARKARKEHLGDFDVVRRDYAFAHIWTLDVAAAFKKPAAGTQRTKGRDFHVGEMTWSPDGTRMAFSATASPDLVQIGTSDVYLLEASIGRDESRVETRRPAWSGLEPALVTRRLAAGLRVRHGPRRLLSRERPPCDGAGRRRNAAVDLGRVRRGSGPASTGARAASTSGAAEDGRAPVSLDPGAAPLRA